MSRCVVLLSAGLDSTYNLYKAQSECGVALALTFDYGQKSASAEVRQASAICKKLSINHKVLELKWFRDFTSTSLVSVAALPLGPEINLNSYEISKETKMAVWVPNRNGIFLNIAAGYAEGMECTAVIPGFNAEEATTFSDNSSGFIDALNRSFSFSTHNKILVKCYSTEFTKSQIVSECLKMQVPLEMLWPCYQPGEKWCGQCESCQRLNRAISDNGVGEKYRSCFR